MNYQTIKLKLKEQNLEIFTSQEFVNLFGIDSSHAAVKLTRYKNKGYLESPRRGVYYLKEDPPDKFRIANRLYFPSYVSMESVLSQRGIIPEIVYAITSVTTKATRQFSDQETAYKYFKIKKSAFSGYGKEKDCLVATPEKALVDYLYFASQGKRKLNDRINFSRIDRKAVLYYVRLFDNHRLDKLIEELF